MISLVVKTTIFLDLSQDEYDRRCRCYFVSPTFCWKILNRIPLKKVIRRLPEVLCFDEYKTTQNSDNGLAFVYPDVITYELFDILDSRKQWELITYFFKFPRTERLKVKEIVMDMNTNYLALLPILFPNAIPVIDGFYVVQQLSRAFNQLQIKELNRLKKCLETTGKSIESQKNTGEIYSSMTVKK